MNRADFKASEAENEILRTFRQYRVGQNEMLFFNRGPSKARPQNFNRALESLIQRGMLIQERHPDAYSLTTRGYRASRAIA